MPAKSAEPTTTNDRNDLMIGMMKKDAEGISEFLSFISLHRSHHCFVPPFKLIGHASLRK